MATVEIHTIGHSDLPAERLFWLLARHLVTHLIDVRSAPYSRHNPQFNRETLARTASQAGLTYDYRGDRLGGRPADPAWRERFTPAVEALVAEAGEKRLALLCAEEDPGRCHRHHLIARALADRGVKVWHIRRTGGREAARFDPPEVEPQLELFR